MDDPFALLQIDPAFALDESRLRSRFLEASARCHPDRFTDPVDQADAAERMGRLTQAYRVLSEPGSRAVALLHRRGGAATSAGDKPDALPPDLLMEMMEVRESLETAVADNDTAKIAELRAWAEQQKHTYLDRLAGLFEADADAANAQAIQTQLNGLRYIERMLEQMPSPSDAG